MKPGTRLEVADVVVIAALAVMFCFAYKQVHGPWPHVGLFALYFAGLWERHTVYRLAKVGVDEAKETTR